MIFPSPTKNPQSSLNDKIRNKTKTELLELELLLHSNPGDCQHRGLHMLGLDCIFTRVPMKTVPTKLVQKW